MSPADRQTSASKRATVFGHGEYSNTAITVAPEQLEIKRKAIQAGLCSGKKVPKHPRSARSNIGDQGRKSRVAGSIQQQNSSRICASEMPQKAETGRKRRAKLGETGKEEKKNVSIAATVRGKRKKKHRKIGSHPAHFRISDSIVSRMMQLLDISSWNGGSVGDFITHSSDFLRLPQAMPNDQRVTSFYQSPLPRSDIVIVDTLDAFHRALVHFESLSDPIIGVDSEWRPTFRKDQHARLALLQMASRERCYLLDIFTLKRTAGREEWRHLADVFRNPRLIKLGFDLTGDMQVLRPFLPGYDGDHLQNGFIDLRDLTESSSRPKGFRGLAGLVQLVFGAPLLKGKRLTMSNWEARPLGESQISYAATDAHCLVEIVVYLREKYAAASRV